MLTQAVSKRELFQLALKLILTLSVCLIFSQVIFGKSLLELARNEKAFTLLVFLNVSAAHGLFLISAFLKQITSLRVRAMLLFALVSPVLLLCGLFSNNEVFAFLTICTAIVVLADAAFNKRLIFFSVPLFIIAVALQPFGSAPSHYVSQMIKTVIKPEPLPNPRQFTMESTLHLINTEFHSGHLQCSQSNPECVEPRNGGAIANLANGFIAMTGAGEFHYLAFDDKDQLRSKHIKQALPMNTQAFIDAGWQNSLWLFRVTDMLIRERGNNYELFVSHHVWLEEEQCFVLQISKTEGVTDQLINADQPKVSWSQVFRTSPCLKIQEQWAWPFRGDESGGRMGFMEDGILMTTGDHGFDLANSSEAFAQLDDYDYGKTLYIDLNSGESTHFTKGHRNPQGLWIDEDGTIWSTENGPKGGDELNILKKGKNYGWPYVTYGANYESHSWPISKQQGHHEEYEKPAFAWLPSIGMSNLIRLKDPSLTNWKDDFIVASYKRRIWRVRTEEDRIIFAEPLELPVEMQGRVRDLIEDKQGRIVFLTDYGNIGTLSAVQNNQDQTNTENKEAALAFKQCSVCHSKNVHSGHGVGPNLAEVFERPIASAEGFAYSTALKQKGGSWTQENLMLFLSDPQAFAPGNKMSMPGIKDENTKKLIIEYLTNPK